MKKICILSIFFFGMPAIAAADQGDGWRHVRAIKQGNIGVIDVVVVDASQRRNKDVYRAAIGRICGQKLKQKIDLCKVWFWPNEKIAPTSLPMTDAQVRAVLATWVYNGRSGDRGLAWNCDVIRESDRSQCLSK